jgi:hypothetical protein
MLRCKTVELLFDALPIDAWRAFLLRRHLDRCPACQAKLVGVAESRRLLAGPPSPDEWAGLRSRLRARTAAEPAGRARAAGRGRSGRFLRWAPSAAMLLVLAATGIWLAREGGRRPVVPEGSGARDRFELDYIRIGGREAGAYIYQPQGSDIIIVWAEKAP